MSIAELKENFHRIIDETENSELLESYYYMLKFETDPENVKAIERIEQSDEFKKDMEMSLEQIESGKVIPHEEIRKRMHT
ncbi:MAG: hypothetical protein J0M18_14865 [Ignavibacteria bacterium]|nr:hypothetical protein [Ignavibacteria bacterium]